MKIIKILVKLKKRPPIILVKIREIRGKLLDNWPPLPGVGPNSHTVALRPQKFSKNQKNKKDTKTLHQIKFYYLLLLKLLTFVAWQKSGI